MANQYDLRKPPTYRPQSDTKAEAFDRPIDNG